jgi:hypothetical protein
MEGTVLAVVYRTVLYCMCKDPRSSKQLSSVDDNKMNEGCRLRIHDMAVVRAFSHNGLKGLTTFKRWTSARRAAEAIAEDNHDKESTTCIMYRRKQIF